VAAGLHSDSPDELAGAVTVALGVARQAVGELPIAAITAAEAV